VVGNAGRATLKIVGDSFVPELQAQLMAPDATLIEGQVFYQDAATVFATFDLASVKAGSGQYDLTVINPGPESVTKYSTLTVEAGGSEKFEVSLVVPGMSRPGRKVKILVEYRNTGTIDIPSPLLTIVGVDGAAWLPLWRVEGDSGASGNHDWIEDSCYSFLALSPDGPASILRPGGSDTLEITVRTPFSGSQMPLNLYALGTSKNSGFNQPIDWAVLENELRPPGMTDDAWIPFSARLKTQIGTTWGDYIEMLRDNANHMSRLGQRLYDSGELLAFEFVQASRMGAPQYLESRQDAFSPEPGLPLSFVRNYCPQPAYRARIGTLGRGWTHSYEIALSERSDGSVVINGANGFDRVFSSDGNGGYTPARGDYARLTAQPAGEYLLTEKDGRQIHFRSNGRFDSINDRNGNRIMAGYDGNGRLTWIVHSNGDRFGMAYDGYGRLISLTDDAGWVTTYAYDASGEHLESVTGPDGGRTTYRYDTGGESLTGHNLVSVERPGGEKITWRYDTLGRIESQHIGTDDELIRYTYNSAGRMLRTDAFTNTVSLYVDSRGNPARIVDARGTPSDLAYDDNANLTGITDRKGRSYRAAYDAQGNMTWLQDAMGHISQFLYGGDHGQLKEVRNARENPRAYNYDGLGNLATITDAAGAVESFTHDSYGNLVARNNRRGNAINCTYNKRGQLLSKTYLDGTTFSYTYDSAGRLVSTVDAIGTNVVEYVPKSDWIKKVTTPKGRRHEIRYDEAGRRTQMVDQTGFTLNYRYDTAGRLAGLSDSNGQNIVTYSYDAGGRLVREDRGNGAITQREYDANGHLRSLVHHAPDDTVSQRFDYTYDEFGRCTAMHTLDGIWTYDYDANDQLTHAQLSAATTNLDDLDLVYHYDEVGNRVRTISNGKTNTYTVDKRDRYTRVEDVVYEYDADGNITSRTDAEGVSTYAYDAENRLVQATGGGRNWTYDYDALGGLGAVITNGIRLEQIKDPLAPMPVVAELDNDGAVAARYVYASGPVAMWNSDGTLAYYNLDGQGDVVGLSSADGALLNRYTRGPFGATLHKAEKVVDPLQRTGRAGQAQEGSALHLKGGRFYDSRIGRFLNADADTLGATLSGANNPVSLSGSHGPSKGTGGRRDRPYAAPVSGPHQGITPSGKSMPGNYNEWYRLGSMGPGWGWGPPVKIRRNVMPWWQMHRLYACKQWLGFSDKLVGSTLSIHTSYTPEDKFGPAGYDTPGTGQGNESRYIRPGETCTYRIEFWNKEDATVPTQDAVIEDILDTNVFDTSTFEFTEIGFLKWEVPLPGGQAINRRVDLRPDMNIAVDVTGTFDPETGKARWWFHCVDPLTGDYPEDPMAGFLPPFNPETGYEIGWVEFVVKVRSDLGTAVTVANQAFVEFDFAGDITNHPAPKEGPWVNTIDASPPTSAIEPLPATVDKAEFVITWQGDDDGGGAGIVSYDVYVSQDGSPYVAWITGTTGTTAVIRGKPGVRYRFFSVARDGVGNVESAPTGPDAETRTKFHLMSLRHRGTFYKRRYFDEDESAWYTQKMLNVEFIIMNWSTVTGKYYTVYSTTNLMGTWTNMTSPIMGDGADMSYTGTVSDAAHKYFKIGVDLNP